MPSALIAPSTHEPTLRLTRIHQHARCVEESIRAVQRVALYAERLMARRTDHSAPRQDDMFVSDSTPYAWGTIIHEALHEVVRYFVARGHAGFLRRRRRRYSQRSPGTTNGGTPPNNGGTPPDNGSTPPNGGGTPPGGGSTPGRFEETDAAVTLSAGHWTATAPSLGGAAAPPCNRSRQEQRRPSRSPAPGSLGSAPGKQSGIALVSVDGGPAKRVDLFARPNEIRTPIITLHDLSPGQHTLTIQVTGEKNKDAPLTSPAVVVVDAFDVEAPIVSHLQDRDPAAVYTGTWALARKAAYPPHGPRGPY